MEGVMSSSPKLLADKTLILNRAFSCTCRALLFTPHQIRFFPSHKKLNHHSISFKFKAIQSSQTQANVGTAEALNPATNQLKNVHVKFQLQKECLFGEQFLLVGDDPIFGLWDPENAIPLDWSDGHTWTVELDLPMGKSIKFKFILKGIMGEVVWQPGSDRVLQTWETKNTIIVLEDWADANVQKITEEEPMVNPNTELIVSENISNPKEEVMGYMNKKPLVAENISCPKDLEDANVQKITEEEPMVNPNTELIVSENISNPKEEVMGYMNKKPLVAENISCPKDWEDANVQKITEEEPMVNPNSELIVSENISNPKEEVIGYMNKKPLVAENITCPKTEPFMENISCSKEEPKANVNKESMVVEKKICLIEEPRANPKEEMIVAENIVESNGKAIPIKRPMSIKDEDCLVNYEGEPVLVPGLTPLPTIATRETLPKEVDNGTVVDASAGADEPEGENLTKKHDKKEHKEATTVMFSDGPMEEQAVDGLGEKPHLTKEQEQTDCETDGEDVLQKDIQWGGKTLHKLLRNLGFISNQLI